MGHRNVNFNLSIVVELYRPIVLNSTIGQASAGQSWTPVI